MGLLHRQAAAPTLQTAVVAVAAVNLQNLLSTTKINIHSCTQFFFIEPITNYHK